jgi:3-hydroxybutyryl-CoA dehydratase
MVTKTIDELTVGDTAEFSKTISESDVYLYSGITGDFNPAHINEAYAAGTRFKTRIVQWSLLAGLTSAVVGTQLPGYGTIYTRQELQFLAPVRIGDTITARVEVAEIMTDRDRVRLRTSCINQDGTMVMDGEAIVSPPRAGKK